VTNWDPNQYLKFGEERLRPALDLVARIPHPAPRLVVDLGCGAGNAMPILAARFPGAKLLGVDSSTAMLAKAAVGGFATVQADIGTWQPEAPVDVLFSNAALHWLDDHAALFPRLLGLLAPGGVLAVQMPAMNRAPLRSMQEALATDDRFAPWLAGIRNSTPILSPGEYYGLLRPRVAALEMWVTEYLHILSGEDPVVQWAMGTSLRPYLDALPADRRVEFLAAYAAALRPHYPRQADGTVMLPFRRLFILARL
jgi:trans-aconitate 2-methyltransferase